MDVNDDSINLGQGALLIGELDPVDLSNLESMIADLENKGTIGEIELEITK